MDIDEEFLLEQMDALLSRGPEPSIPDLHELALDLGLEIEIEEIP